MVKIITDSSSDIPHEVAQELGITVVPLYVRFGNEIYRDGVDMTADQFYSKLAESRILPKTSTPSPGDFVQYYNRLASETDEILSIHLSTRYSGAYNAAMIAKNYVQGKCRVEVIDSKSVSMGCGLVAIAAAQAGVKGATLQQVMEIADDAILRTHFIGMVTNIEYLFGGKRLSAPRLHAFLGRVGTTVRAKLIGEIYEAGKVRGRGIFLSRAGALKKLERCLTEVSSIEEMSTLFADTPDWAQDFINRIALVFPKEHIYRARFGCITGVHTGPEAIAIAFTERRD